MAVTSLPSPDAACTAVAGSMARISAAAEASGLVAVAELALQRRAEGRSRGLSADECDEFTADEVGALLHMSRPAARARLFLALDLLQRRSATLAALTRGDICLVRARRMSEGLALVADDVVGDVEQEALRVAPGQTPAQLTARLVRLVLRADAEAARRRTQAAVRDRRCSIRVLHDGTALLQVVGRTELVVAAYERIDRAARGLLGSPPVAASGAAGSDLTPAIAGSAGVEATAQPSGTSSTVTPVDPGRRLDQTRADVVIGLLVGDPDTVAAGAGVQVTIDVVAPVGTLLGGDAPGELVGYGPVPAELVRELAEEASWRRWVTDAEGAVVARSTRRYRPTAAMVQLLRARDGTCRFPTCRRRASACDLDHVVPWPQGPTGPENLAVLCRHHHRLKHAGGWSVRLDPDGSLRWCTPAGEEHVSPGRRLGEDVPPPRRGGDGPPVDDGPPADPDRPDRPDHHGHPGHHGHHGHPDHGHPDHDPPPF